MEEAKHAHGASKCYDDEYRSRQAPETELRTFAKSIGAPNPLFPGKTTVSPGFELAPPDILPTPVIVRSVLCCPNVYAWIFASSAALHSEARELSEQSE